MCPPAVFNTKKTTERHTVTSEHRNEGDYGRALIITQFFLFVFFLSLSLSADIEKNSRGFVLAVS